MVRGHLSLVRVTAAAGLIVLLLGTQPSFPQRLG